MSLEFAVPACWFLFGLSWKVLLLAIVIGVGLRLARVESATWSHRAWTLGLIGMLAMPLLVGLAPRIPLAILAAVASPSPVMPEEPASVAAISAAVDKPISASTQQPPVVAAQPAASPAMLVEMPPALPEPPSPVRATQAAIADGNAASTPKMLPRWIDVAAAAIVLVYLTGATVILIRLAVGVWQCRRLIRRCASADLSDQQRRLTGNVRVLESAEVVVPICLGVLRPTIILPADWRTWRTVSIDMALAHEAEHIRRRDPLMATLALANVALYWFHPVAWFVRRQLADLAEHACDDAVISQLDRRPSYAHSLVQMAIRVSDGAGRFERLGIGMARKPQVEERVDRIMDEQRTLSQRIGLQGSTVLFLLIAAAAVIAAGVTAVRQSHGQEATPPVAAKSISGVVVSSEDRPVAGAEVRLATYNKAISNYEDRVTQTDAAGKFRFDDVTAGTHRLVALYQDQASRDKRYRGPKVNPGEEVQLKLQSAPALQVEVLDAASGRPISEGRVRLTWSDVGRDQPIDANGVARIRGLTPELWTIEVQAKGYAEHGEAIQLAGTETAKIVARLEPGFVLSGVVRDEHGTPVADAGFSVFPSDLRGGQIEYMTTDEQGRYRFDYLPRQGLRLMVSKEGYDSLQESFGEIGAPMGERTHDLTLAKRKHGGSIEGTVVDADGKPIAGAELSNPGSSTKFIRKTKTDAAGRFRLDDLYARGRRHLLFVRADGMAPQELQVTPGTLEKPAQAPIRMSPGRTISGTVVDPQGSPISGVTVDYRGPTGHDDLEYSRRTTTDAEGRFTLDSLTATAPLTFQKAGRSTISDREFPQEDEQPIVVTLLAEGVIRGRAVDDKTGKPVSPILLKVTFSPERTADDPSGSLRSMSVVEGEKFAKPDGTFEQRGHVQGMPLQVTIEAPGYRKEVKTRVVAAAADQAQQQEFRLKRIDDAQLRTYAGIVVDKDGVGLPGVELRLIASKQWRFPPRDDFPFNWTMVRRGQLDNNAKVSQFLTATTDQEGAFKFTGVLPGPDIELAYWGGGASQGRVENWERLTEEERGNIVVKTIAVGSLQGKINRKRFADFDRLMLSGGGDFVAVKMDAGGSEYSAQSVSAGSYELQIYGPTREMKLADRTYQTNDVIYRERVTIEPGVAKQLDVGFAEPAAVAKPPAEMKPAQPAAVAEPAKESADPQIAGQVVDSAGKPIAGARLWLPIAYNSEPSTLDAVADAAGRFSFVVPQEKIDADRTYLMGTAWCYAPEYQIGSVNLSRQLRHGWQQPVQITLEPLTDTAFVVETLTGDPIPGVRVDPLNYKAERGYDLVPKPMQQLLGKVTDDAGRVMLPQFGRGYLSHLKLTSPEYGEQQLRVINREDVAAERHITLMPTGRVAGKLMTNDPDVLASATISLIPADRDQMHAQGYAVTTPDDQGAFEIPRIAAGEYRISVYFKDADLHVRARTPESIRVDIDQTTKIDLPFEQAIPVRGRVRTQEGQRPIEGAMVSITKTGAFGIQQLFTDANGEYTGYYLPGETVRMQLIIRPKAYDYWIEPPNKDWMKGYEIPADATEFTLPPIELVETEKIAGKLIDTNERPVAGYDLTAVQGNRRFSFARSDADGAFTFHLPKGFAAEGYELHPTNGRGGSVKARVLSDSPLLLQLP